MGPIGMHGFSTKLKMYNTVEPTADTYDITDNFEIFDYPPVHFNATPE